jgi:hypothetical protein
MPDIAICANTIFFTSLDERDRLGGIPLCPRFVLVRCYKLLKFSCFPKRGFWSVKEHLSA